MEQTKDDRGPTIVVRDELLADPACAEALATLLAPQAVLLPSLDARVDRRIADRLAADDAALQRPARIAVALATALDIPIESLVDAGLQHVRDDPATTRAELAIWLLRKIANGMAGALAAEVARDLLEHAP